MTTFMAPARKASLRVRRLSETKGTLLFRTSIGPVFHKQ